MIDEVLQAFFNVDGEIDDLLLFIHVEGRFRNNVDVAAFAVKFCEALEGLAKTRLLIDLTRNKTQLRLEHFARELSVARELDLADPISLWRLRLTDKDRRGQRSNQGDHQFDVILHDVLDSFLQM